jgi:hypothetical protein
LFGRKSSKVDQTPEAAEKLAKRRSMLQGMILMNGLDRKPFGGAQWPYFFTDLRDEIQAAKVALPNGSAKALADSLDALPADAVLRLYAAYFVYISPLEPEREVSVDELLSVFDRAGAQRMRKRRAAVQALIVAQEREKALRLAEANRRQALEMEHMRCPRGRLDLRPNEFLQWVQAQTPDTWHLIVCGWEYDDDSYNSALSWILDQRQCDVGTAARFFFFAAMGLATEDPEKLRPYHRAQWELMKKAADRWSAEHYLHPNWTRVWTEPMWPGSTATPPTASVTVAHWRSRSLRRRREASERDCRSQATHITAAAVWVRRSKFG